MGYDSDMILIWWVTESQWVTWVCHGICYWLPCLFLHSCHSSHTFDQCYPLCLWIRWCRGKQHHLCGREQLKQKLRQGLATMHRPQSANPTQNSATIGNHKSEDVLDGSVWSGLAGPSISIPNQNKYQRLHAKVLLHSHVWTFKQFCSASLSKVF